MVAVQKGKTIHRLLRAFLFHTGASGRRRRWVALQEAASEAEDGGIWDDCWDKMFDC